MVTLAILGICDIDKHKISEDQKKIPDIETNDDLIVPSDHSLVLLQQFHAELVHKGRKIAIKPQALKPIQFCHPKQRVKVID